MIVIQLQKMKYIYTEDGYCGCGKKLYRDCHGPIVGKNMHLKLWMAEKASIV